MNDTNFNDEFDVAHQLGYMRDDDLLREADLAVGFADEDGHQLKGVVIEDVPASPPQDERIGALASVIFRNAPEDCSGVLVATRRTGSSDVRGDDLAWHDALTFVVNRLDLASHGVYLVTDEAVTRVQPLTNAA